MLSYRHGFHAGNHADVLKHTVLVSLLGHLSRKDRPWCYVDTHAGAGRYDLTDAWACRNAEHTTGITRLWQRTDLPRALADYVAHVQRLNDDGTLRFYPGSPQFALQCARANDCVRLFELHRNEGEVLRRNLARMKTNARIAAEDGLAALASVLPPPSRRGLVLIDPSYEERADYARVAAALAAGLKRFSTGMYLVWYPQIQRPEARAFAATLARIAHASGVDWLDATLRVRTPSADGLGMHGSGVSVLNPAYTLPRTLAPALQYLREVLAQDEGAAVTLEYRIA